MSEAGASEKAAVFHVRNVGGIDETTVTVLPGVTVLAGRNATNRTSFLQAVMAVMGSDNASVKADADTGHVELRLGDETYSRTLSRADEAANAGDPYLDDPEIADLFAFLLESNEARRAVARGDDLRELIVRPVDVRAIRAEIRELERKKDEIDDELDELEAIKGELPELEQERARLRNAVERKRSELETKETEIDRANAGRDDIRGENADLEDRLGELREKRAALKRIRSDIDLQQDSIGSLTTERRELKAEREELPDAPTGEREELDRQIKALREEKRRHEGGLSDLQDVIQFNEDVLAGEESTAIGGLSENDGAVADRLLEEDAVVCWTCGTEVDRERIETTVDALRERRMEILGRVGELEDALAELKAAKNERRKQQRRRRSIERKLDELTAELDQRTSILADLREKAERHSRDIEELEAKIERLESEEFDELLSLHGEANQLEFELERLQSEFDDVTDRIETVENRLDAEDRLRAQRADVREDLTELRTRIDRIERSAVAAFNEHMESVLDVLAYDNLERIWLERVGGRARESRRNVENATFELHVIRSTETGATYEDTIDHLSESEREVTGLVFALAGYLVYDLHESVPFMLLDSLEAIDSKRIADLVEYVSDHVPYVLVALLPEDARELDGAYARVTDI